MAININTKYGQIMDSKQLNNKFHSIIGQNCIKNGFEVSIKEDNVSLTLSPGECSVNGAFIEYTEPTEVTLTESQLTHSKQTLYIRYEHRSSHVNLLLTDSYDNITEDDVVICDIIIADGRITEVEQPEAIPTLAELAEMVRDLSYVPISIKAFTNNRNTVEKGCTVNGVDLAWTLSKTAKIQSLNGQPIDNSLRGFHINDVITANRTFTLAVTDKKGTTVSKSTSITFANGVYYGSLADHQGVDFKSRLTKVLSDARGRSITVNCEDGEYIYYILPARLGKCTFKVNGFDGGFELVETINFENSYNFSESYYVYKSVNHSLGNTSIGIS